MKKGLSEKDYISVSELAQVRMMEDILQQIIPANSIVITDTEYREVRSILRKWRIDLFAEIGVT